MTDGPTVVFEVTRLEAAHLAALTTQYLALLDAADTTDPAVGRLVPDAYADDPDAAGQFRDLTQDDLLGRRRSDAGAVLESLFGNEVPPGPQDLGDDAETLLSARLDADQTAAWLRTLTGLRLVLATRLGITEEDDRDNADPRLKIFDWLGYRLEGLLQAVDELEG